MKTGIIKTNRFLLCPNCGESEHSIEHLMKGFMVPDPTSSTAEFGVRPSRDFGPWSCDECDHSFGFRMHHDGSVEITDVKKITEPKVLCLLRFRDLYVVAGPYREYGDDGWYDYFFHSHQCPYNIMHQVRAVFDAAEGEDPHGSFRFISSIPYMEKEEDGGERWTGGMSLEALFRMFKTDGQEAETEWPESERGLLPGIAALQDSYAKQRAPKA